MVGAADGGCLRVKAVPWAGGVQAWALVPASSSVTRVSCFDFLCLGFLKYIMGEQE